MSTSRKYILIHYNVPYMTDVPVLFLDAGHEKRRLGVENCSCKSSQCCSLCSLESMPPKKKNKNQPRNAFYFYMVSLRPELQRQGVVLENGMQSLAEIAGPRWKVCCISKDHFLSHGLSFSIYVH